MAIDNPAKRLRKVYEIANKYQQDILLMVFILHSASWRQ